MLIQGPKTEWYVAVVDRVLTVVAIVGLKHEEPEGWERLLCVVRSHSGGRFYMVEIFQS